MDIIQPENNFFICYCWVRVAGDIVNSSKTHNAEMNFTEYNIQDYIPDKW